MKITTSRTLALLHPLLIKASTRIGSTRLWMRIQAAGGHSYTWWHELQRQGESNKLKQLWDLLDEFHGNPSATETCLVQLAKGDLEEAAAALRRMGCLGYKKPLPHIWKLFIKTLKYLFHL